MSNASGRLIERCVVVGGSGAVGRMFVHFLVQQGIDTCVIDLTNRGDHSPGVRHLVGDITAPEPDLIEELRRADLLLLAVPESVALATVKIAASHLPTTSLLTHTCSVHVPISTQILETEGEFEALGLNPMFGPSLDPHGRPIAASVLRDGPLVQHLLSILREAGSDVVLVSETDHDRISAITQCATHAAMIAYGLTFLDSDISIDELSVLSPPPCMTFLALIARAVSGVPEVYWDVQFANPNAAGIRQKLAKSIELLDAKVDDNDLAGFEQSFADIAAFFGPRLKSFASIGQEMFSKMPPSVNDPLAN